MSAEVYISTDIEADEPIPAYAAEGVWCPPVLPIFRSYPEPPHIPTRWSGGPGTPKPGKLHVATRNRPRL